MPTTGINNSRYDLWVSLKNARCSEETIAHGLLLGVGIIVDDLTNTEE